MRTTDPRIRQTLNQISQTLESANLNTQASLFTFSESYLSPCLSSISNCIDASCPPCLPAQRRDVERRRNRNRMGRNTQRGRPELSFDFYDDWDDEEEGAGLLGGWGNDELDRLLAGSGGGEGIGDQPRRHARMSYGSRGGQLRKKGGPSKDEEGDPTIVPSSSVFGFLERLPWKIAGRGLRYKPSVADLQDNVGRKAREEGQVLLEESEGEDTIHKHQRKRSGTNASRSTTNSLSSRGDLFPSEDEDDAVPLDDEFAMALERRITGPGADDGSSRKTKGKRPSASRTSTKTGSSKDTKSSGVKGRRESMSSVKKPEVTEATGVGLPSMDDLKREEVRVRAEEEAEVERKRQSAQKLARERGLSIEGEDGALSPGYLKPTDSESQESPPSPTTDLSILHAPPQPVDEKLIDPPSTPKDPPPEPHTTDRPSHNFTAIEP